MEGRPLPPAGWHPDPEDETSLRYWDGTQWTDSRAPRPQAAEDKGAGVLVVVGYLTAFLLPIVGFILGIVLMVRRQTGHGLAVFLISIAVGIGACAIALSDAEEEVDQAATELEQDLDEAQRDLNKDLREDQRAFDAYDDCLKENNYRFAPCRELDPLR
jgi:hypothetical protein